MDNEQRLTFNFPALAVRRPLSAAVGVLAGIVILVALYLRFSGHMLLSRAVPRCPP